MGNEAGNWNTQKPWREAGQRYQTPKPKHVWNRIPEEVRRRVVKLALKETKLSPGELAVTFTDQESSPCQLSLGPMRSNGSISEASVYRALKAHDLITSPAFIAIKVANEYKDNSTAIHQLWQAGLTISRSSGGDGFISAQSFAATAVTTPLYIVPNADLSCEIVRLT